MWSSNPTWGSKRIQAELAKLEIEVSDSTIRKYRPRTRRNDQTWKTFLHNHAKDLIAVDFFVVPTAAFRVLYVFPVPAHERRKILHSILPIRLRRLGPHNNWPRHFPTPFHPAIRSAIAIVFMARNLCSGLLASDWNKNSLRHAPHGRIPSSTG